MKNPHAVALGKHSAKKQFGTMTPTERSLHMKKVRAGYKVKLEHKTSAEPAAPGSSILPLDNNERS